MPDFERTPWWNVITTRHDIERILICRQYQSITAREAIRRFYRNVKRHGLLFIPYRVGLLVFHQIRRLWPSETQAPAVCAIPYEVASTPRLHNEETLERVTAFGADLGLSIGAPILRSSLFRLPRRGTINLHLGKVPEFRGAPPGFWELVHEAQSVAATVHWMDEGLDTGPVISECVAPIFAEDSLADVTARLTELGIHALSNALEAIAAGEPNCRTQPVGGKANRSPTLGQRMSLASRLTGRRVRSRLTPRRVVKDFAAIIGLYVYRPARDVVRTIRRRHPVRIFTFHRVTTLCRDGMTLTPTQFGQQVDYLSRHHRIVSLEEGIRLVRSGARLSRPVAVLTFDDAYRSVYTTAWPVLSQRRLPATCFVSTDLVGTDRRFEHDAHSGVQQQLPVMDWSELAELRAHGWTLGAHTANHVRLSCCPADVLRYEIEEPRRALQSKLSSDAAVLAFPFGGRDDISPQALEVAQAVGHTTVLADYDGENHTGNSSFVLGRFDIGGDRSKLSWKALAHGLDLGQWRHLWPA
jgi:peptidoglycan/xylan/chitin deacetylase (PgdA/CDA1 family)/folate-dependent phosphoribosylglycinamide formyltransferase PurN